MFEDYEKVLNTIKAGFHNRPVLVIGDLILDIYYRGKVHRISPEAPVPIVHLQGESWSGGGAANVALNLSGLGLSVKLAGLVGQDNEKDKLFNVLKNNGIDTNAVITAKIWQTISKTRIMADNHLMLRLDREVAVRCTSEELSFLAEAVEAAINERPSAIVLSDYAKGVLTEALCRRVIALAREKNIPVLVDPKGRDYSKYAGATLISPNRSELATAVDRSSDDLDILMQAGRELRRSLDLPHLLVTLSEQGIALIQEEGLHYYPATAKEVYDVSGAGDTVIAVMASGIVGGLNLQDTIHLANIAAGIVVARVGIYPITTGDLIKAISQEQGLEQSEKICQPENLLLKVEQWRQKGQRIVFTNGCFDLLHAGHVTYLEDARRYGDRLIVGLNTDRSVRELKGPARPVIREQDRARVLAALSAVDAVVLFDESTPLTLIKNLRPEVLAKGADYTEDHVVGSEFIKSNGGRVVLIPLMEGRSSSAIIDGVKKQGTERTVKEIKQCTS